VWIGQNDMGLDTEDHRANVESISVEHTTRLAAAPEILSLATTTPESSDMGSIPTCVIQNKSTPKFVITGLLGLSEKVTMENESTIRQA